MVRDPDSVGYVDPNPNSDPDRQKLPVGKRIEIKWKFHIFKCVKFSFGAPKPEGYIATFDPIS